MLRWARGTHLRRAVLVCAAALAAEMGRGAAERSGAEPIVTLMVGGAGLCLLGLTFKPEELGLGREDLWRRAVGGLGLAVVLLLPAAARWHGGPVLPTAMALPAIVVSVGEEVAFRGAAYAALELVGGARLAVIGSAALFTAGHVLTHPPAFLLAVAALGLLLGLWRWACRDLVGPILAHSVADLAL